ncbi:MAG: CHRD domain-containing protein [Ramlibacter sp.]
MRPFLAPAPAAFAAGVLALALAGCAHREPAEPELFEATLEASQVPAAGSGASGRAALRYTARGQLLRWEISHAGLSGPVAGGHVHGPAGPGQAGAIVFPLSGPLDTAPIRGQLRLSPEQYGQLRSGQWYVDLHTARFPQGELRGQLRPVPH